MSNENSVRMEAMGAEKKAQILETKQKLLDAIGKEAYGGVDIFEDTKPLKESRSSMGPADPLRSDGRSSDDPGVDISGIMALGGKNWKALMS